MKNNTFLYFTFMLLIFSLLFYFVILRIDIKCNFVNKNGLQVKKKRYFCKLKKLTLSQ